jgi:hypothetical protein
MLKKLLMTKMNRLLRLSKMEENEIFGINNYANGNEE